MPVASLGITGGTVGVGAAAAALGLVTGAGGAYLSGQAAGQKRQELRSTLDQWLPNPSAYQENYFADLSKYFPEAQGLSNRMADAEQAQALKLREQAVPGFNAGVQSAAPGIFSLMRGELPPSVLANFQRAGGASTVGLGFGGTDFGALNTGLFGARGSLGAMQQGFGLLPALMSTIPKVSVPSAATFLGQGIMTPEQMTQTQMQIRGQNLSVESQLAQMKSSKDVWGGWLGNIGGSLFGAGMSMMGGGMGGMGGGGGVPYNNPTQGYQGNLGGAGGGYYYNVPVTYGQSYGGD